MGNRHKDAIVILTEHTTKERLEALARELAPDIIETVRASLAHELAPGVRWVSEGRQFTNQREVGRRVDAAIRQRLAEAAEKPQK